MERERWNKKWSLNHEGDSRTWNVKQRVCEACDKNSLILDCSGEPAIARRHVVVTFLLSKGKNLSDSQAMTQSESLSETPNIIIR